MFFELNLFFHCTINIQDFKMNKNHIHGRCASFLFVQTINSSAEELPQKQRRRWDPHPIQGTEEEEEDNPIP